LTVGAERDPDGERPVVRPVSRDGIGRGSNRLRRGFNRHGGDFEIGRWHMDSGLRGTTVAGTIRCLVRVLARRGGRLLATAATAGSTARSLLLRRSVGRRLDVLVLGDELVL
jgi:hypothetical protein